MCQKGILFCISCLVLPILLGFFFSYRVGFCRVTIWDFFTPWVLTLDPCSCQGSYGIFLTYDCDKSTSIDSWRGKCSHHKQLPPTTKRCIQLLFSFSLFDFSLSSARLSQTLGENWPGPKFRLFSFFLAVDARRSSNLSCIQRVPFPCQSRSLSLGCIVVLGPSAYVTPCCFFSSPLSEKRDLPPAVRERERKRDCCLSANKKNAAFSAFSLSTVFRLLLFGHKDRRAANCFMLAGESHTTLASAPYKKKKTRMNRTLSDGGPSL